MLPEEIKQEINKLDLAQRIILVEDIWDAIAQNNKEIQMPQWQKQELETRYKAYKRGEYKTITWEEVHSRLKARFCRR